MKVYWTETSADHLKAIHAEVSRKSLTEARTMIHGLTRRMARASESPHSSPVSPEFQAEHVREVFEGNYRLIYLIQPDRINVLAVLTTSR